MDIKHSYRLKPIIRLIALLAVECFLISSIAPDYEIRSLLNDPITQILREDYTDYKEPIAEILKDDYVDNSRSLAGSLNKEGLRQLEPSLSHEAPDCLSPPLETGNFSKKDIAKLPTRRIQPVSVLILDDDLPTRTATRDILTSPEINDIHTTGTMKDALRLLKEHSEINFLVVDFRLAGYPGDPKDNGVELCIRAFEEYNFNGRVVIYSAETDVVKKVLLESPILKERFLKGQISIQSKQEPDAVEIIKREIIAFTRGGGMTLPEEKGITFTGSGIHPDEKVTIEPGERIIDGEQQTLQKLAGRVLDILKKRGHPKATDELAQKIAREVYIYSKKVAEITKIRETVAYDPYFEKPNRRVEIETILFQYFQATCEDFRNIVFEKGTTEEDIENLLLSLLELKKVEKKEDIVFAYLSERQAIVLEYDSKGKWYILLRSRKNLEREKEGVTQERREEYQRTLRLVGEWIHQIAGDIGLIISYVKLLKAVSPDKSQETLNLYNQELPMDIIELVHMYTVSSAKKLTGFEDDILMIERVDGWKGVISDLVIALTNLMQRLEKELDGIQLGDESEDKIRMEAIKSIVSKIQTIRQLLNRDKFDDKEFIDITNYPDKDSLVYRSKKFHFSVAARTRLWLKKFFLEHIMSNIFSCVRDENFYVTAKEEDGWTVFNITYKGNVDIDTMFQPKKSSDEPWHRGPLILDLVSAVDGRITAENIGENVQITIRFPLPTDKIREGI